MVKINGVELKKFEGLEYEGVYSTISKQGIHVCEYDVITSSA